MVVEITDLVVISVTSLKFNITLASNPCASCDLAALYSNTFCPRDDGCENFYPLDQAAKVVNGTPPCIEVQNLCPPDAFVGLDHPGSETSLPSPDYAGIVHIECDSMGQWQATVQEANKDGTSNAVVSPIQKLSCYRRKDCATCWDAVVTTDHQICLDLMQPKECIDSSNITSGFARDVMCSSLLIVYQGNTVIQLDTGYTMPPKKSAASRRLRTMEVEKSFDVSDQENEEPEEKNKPVKKNAKKTKAPTKLNELQSSSETEKADDDESDIDFSNIFKQIFENPKGTKGLIKKLFTHHREAIESTDLNTLRRAIWTPHFVAVPEGQKFCARAFEKVTPHGVMVLLGKCLKLGNVSSETCVHYSDMIYHGWKYACSDNNNVLREEIEEKIFMGLFTNVIMLDIQWSTRFANMLTAVRKGDKSKLDSTLFKCTLPILWRSLKAANPKVRYNASSVLLDFYPLLSPDEQKHDEYLATQNNAIMGMLQDGCVAIRQMAIKKVIRIVSNLFTFLKTSDIRSWLSIIVDKLSKDVDIGSRIAVFESVKLLLPVPACLNVTQKTLECICPHGINDRNERVRLAAFQLLTSLKGHRFIKFFDIVEFEPVMARLEIEESESVRREIVKLIFKSFFLTEADATDKVMRTYKLIKFGRVCSLTFHRLVFTLNLVTVKEAANHLRALALAAYDCCTRIGSGEDPNITDKDITYTRAAEALDETANTLGALSDLPAMDEKNPHFRRTKILIECGLVLWFTMRKELDNHAEEAAKLDKMYNKMFVKLFNFFNKTSLIGPAMMLGSMLPCPTTDGITRTVLTLLNEKVVDDCIIEPYLEASANWKIESLFEIIHSGLDELQTCTSEIQSPARKRGKTSKAPVKLTPNDNLLKALNYLKFLLRSYAINKKVVSKYQYQLEEFYKKLKQVRVVIDHRIRADAPMPVSDESIVRAYEMKQTLSALLLNGQHDTPDGPLVYVRDLCMDLKWFKHEVVPNISVATDQNTVNFLMQLSKVVLGQISVMFLSFDFSSVPTLSKAPSFVKPSQTIGSPNASHDDEEYALDFIDTASSLVVAFCRSSTPLGLADPILRAAKQLLDVHPVLINDAIMIQEFFPSWVIKSFMRDNWPNHMEEKDEKSLADAYWALWKAILDHPDYSTERFDKHVYSLVAITLNLLVQTGAAAAQRAAQLQQQQQQPPPPQERKRSYPCTFQFCVICQKDVHSSKLPCHIRQCHVAKPMFQCPACDFTSTYSKNNVKSHMVSLHGLAGDPISYMDKYAPQVEEFMKLCFPNVRGRGRPMQGRASPRSPASPQHTSRRASQAAPASMVRRPSFPREHELAMAVAQQQQQAALIAQAQRLSSFGLFPTLFNNGLANLTKPAPVTVKTESDATEPGIVSSSASSLDDVISNMRSGLKPLVLQSENKSIEELQLVRPGENQQPKYLPLAFSWNSLSESQTIHTVFAKMNNGFIDFSEVLPSFAKLSDDIFLTEEQRERVKEVKASMKLEGFEVLYAIHRMDMKILSNENIDLLLSIAPSEVDIQRIRRFEKQNPQYHYTNDEQTLISLSQIDHLEEKLCAMKFMGAFDARIQELKEQLDCINAARALLLESCAFKELLYLVLGLQNHLLTTPNNIKGFVVSKLEEICSNELPCGTQLGSIIAAFIRDKTTNITNVFQIIPQLRKASETCWRDLCVEISQLEQSLSRLEAGLPEINAIGDNSTVPEFLDQYKPLVEESKEKLKNCKKELFALFVQMAEPLPYPEEPFEPELFMSKLADFLESLRDQADQIDV